jgi:tetratricopeptide (TPR) repeat protein
MKLSLSELDDVLMTNPEVDTNWYERGDALANQGRYEEALACFEQAIALNPDMPSAIESWVFRAVMLLYLERFDQALESCDRALAIEPAHPEANLFRGVALQRLGLYREAYRSFDRALGATERLSIWNGIGDKARQLMGLAAAGHQLLRYRVLGQKEEPGIRAHHSPLK